MAFPLQCMKVNVKEGVSTSTSTFNRSISHGSQSIVSDEILALLSILPEDLKRSLLGQNSEELLEIVLDLGRPAEARYINSVQPLSQRPVEQHDIDYIVRQVGDFTSDNRAGIERTLHRISAIRSRKGQIVGLTLRVGRAIFGTIDLLKDLIETGSSVLLLGRPGIGKTTKLREVARVLADDFHKRVIVVDTSNEIGGDGDIPHPAIGSARRMQVPRPDQQHSTMIEAVENHMPEVIIVDEIGTESEAAAARTIAERGVQLIGTAHGTTLENLLINPTLSDLVGGVHVVTLSDEEARRRHTTKTVSERRAPPTFDILVEIVNRDEVIIHRDIASAVDSLLSGIEPEGELRNYRSDGQVRIEKVAPPEKDYATAYGVLVRAGTVRIYPYALDKSLLERVIRNLEIDARTVSDPENADIIIALRSRENDLRLRRMLEEKETPLHLIKKNAATYMRKILQEISPMIRGVDPDTVKDAVKETEFAIERVLAEKVEVALAPRIPPVRKMQHRMVTRYHLESQSIGREPLRHLVIYPGNRAM